jgi:hypothetical protein
MNCKFVSYDKKISYNLTFYDQDKVHQGKTDDYWSATDSEIDHIRDELITERKKSGYKLGKILKTYRINDMNTGKIMRVRGNNVIEIFYLGSGFPVIGYTIGKLYTMS